jgi:hypothetical protein
MKRFAWGFLVGAVVCGLCIGGSMAGLFVNGWELRHKGTAAKQTESPPVASKPEIRQPVLYADIIKLIAAGGMEYGKYKSNKNPRRMWFISGPQAMTHDHVFVLDESGPYASSFAMDDFASEEAAKKESLRLVDEHNDNLDQFAWNRFVIRGDRAIIDRLKRVLP